ncbi:MAG TPA: pyridoxamine 5'-phosphate oxidase [Cryomorphaceae bacterium]|nr:pyridoxamine 5'-phosphate oxidase [Owenweeksia sp.]MBF99009.1 pyridoxamine 5'-phosphate oxidase [Owenweeksia sp.]HAD96538.1 pyridoxamine 5'-phosphate oxidase [Cryomorphaceae bacterium]HBF20907.1 pyridoxamine 5'-phosphate oxidase [Cryomorphaceae bacterium]HCQ15218.1 pyridoxamine 5'-phosphate oxidase [Cryomorphaceae bacterium]|tara:strand:- start:330 stop:809 length:480 start_codon:yes stop_codon:yes gene_type:complete
MKESNSIEKLKELAESIRICMYCTHLGPQEKARPMSTARVEENGDIWFFTSAAHDVAKTANNDVVHLLYSHNSHEDYLSVKGTAQLVDDRKKAEELWNPILNAWFPKGLETPDLRLIRVEPTYAEYWEGVSTVRTIFEAVKAKLTGEEGSYGEHGKLSL